MSTVIVEQCVLSFPLNYEDDAHANMRSDHCFNHCQVGARPQPFGTQAARLVLLRGDERCVLRGDELGESLTHAREARLPRGSFAIEGRRLPSHKAAVSLVARRGGRAQACCLRPGEELAIADRAGAAGVGSETKASLVECLHAVKNKLGDAPEDGGGA